MKTGPPEIRHHPRLLLLRRQSLHLARNPTPEHLAARGGLQPAHSLGEHRLLVAPREWMPARVRVVGRSGERARVPGRELEPSDLRGAWGGR